MPTTSDSTEKDFFVSYNGADEEWAVWIAWQLEHADFSVIIQAWDFRPGSNFVLEMDKASKVAERTIVVLSPNFFGSQFTPPEWASAFAKDPTGSGRKMVPVKVEECDVEGLLGQVVYIDLVGMSRDDAALKLIAGIQPGRSKPSTEPTFPGTGTRVEQAPPSPGAFVEADLDWKPQAELPVTWRAALSRNYRSGTSHAILEVALVPTEELLIPVRRVGELPDELATAGRQGGLFDASQQVSGDSSADFAYVQSTGDFSAVKAGMMIGRNGQRGAWISLPHDMMGSVLDEDELSARLASVLTLLMSLDVPQAQRYAVTASLGPTMMLTVGSVSVVGNRNTASMMSAPEDPIVLPVEDSVSAASITPNAQQLAQEIIARLVARTKRRN